MTHVTHDEKVKLRDDHTKKAEVLLMMTQEYEHPNDTQWRYMRAQVHATLALLYQQQL